MGALGEGLAAFLAGAVALAGHLGAGFLAGFRGGFGGARGVLGCDKSFFCLSRGSPGRVLDALVPTLGRGVGQHCKVSAVAHYAWLVSIPPTAS